MAKTEVEDQYDKLSHQIDTLNEKIEHPELENDKYQSLIEEQEQYSRRTCLKVLHVAIPKQGPIYEFITTQAVMNICNKTLEVKISREDRSRTHILVVSPKQGQ